MAEEGTGIPVADEINGSEDSQEESSDIHIFAVAEISEPEGVIEESIDIPVIAEIIEPEGSNVKVIGEINTPKCRPKVLSRYLLQSTGSCHDFCKYGRKHSLEGKPGNPVLRKVKSAGGDCRDLKRTAISLAKQNKRTVSLKSSPDNKTQFSINNNDLKEDIISSPKIVTLSPERLLPPIKEVEADVVHCIGTKLKLSQSKGSSFAGQRCLRTKRNKEFGKGKEQDGGSSCYKRCQESNTSTEDKKPLVPLAVSSPKNHVKKVENADKNIRRRFHLMNQSYPIKIRPIQSNNEEVQEKTLYIIEPSTKNETDGLVQNGVHTTDLFQPQSSSAADDSLKHDQEVDQTPQVPPLATKKRLSARNGISAKILFPSSSLPWGFSRKKFGIVNNQPSPSSPSSSTAPPEPIHRKQGSPTSGNDVKKSEYSKVEHKSKPQRMGIANSNSEIVDGQSRRVKFRKGKVVDLQPENNVPRRLKFRRVQLLGETQNSKSDSRKRSIQIKEANHNGDEAKETKNNALRQHDQELKRKKNYRRKEIIDGKSTANRIKSERVVLRHQDSKGKKEIQSLFNNVIEETASKLEQTRKSKVKALVGAFETVISLQDTRPSATIGA